MNDLVIQTDIRNGIGLLVSALQQMPQAELPVEHYYAPGVCARQMLISKGVCAVGKIHKYEHLNILLKGDATFITEHDGKMRIQAPYIFVSKAGVQKAVLAHEDTILMCILLTDETDPVKIEEEFTVNTHEEFNLINNNTQYIES